ncbi:bifunctional adenosylcobinamide kinase/adenosylcobinamide-phosphate guanylyltransferase [Maridesulfovibrio ferrireducens]|uniref:Adenosylcobinamide kinase n=1 Tax=Maridesulfovibrio ferrireducens TaxID=246191 RepID=A0A1G9FNA7_9BACT|nr:bifunctional adenosylcobinamide kinase/adenosylcobinamide-phosphate guanylyltransferase [Maridesulfovibrio ferrireducens]MBI9111848.1 bifunctional adenosylcobinamide kinase/adenosylcobinamide-phosphate guanylyltransferase [Maridesulfovibrio ferrireducens]SDK89849.1 adenosylcobinamide kinase /adenosylcobinamide-phosphate guanylyltransferase [Maridesulfovibrio ferrireducens]
MITFILGGNKSGKSDYALEVFSKYSGTKCFIATGKARDMAFRKQIMDHRRERDPSIPVFETGTDLHQVLVRARKDYEHLLVDSLDFWLFSCSELVNGEQLIGEVVRLLSEWKGPDLVLVSCEVGLGPLAMTREVREFVRGLGGLNRRIAAIADEAYLVAAGLPLTLKK